MSVGMDAFAAKSLPWAGLLAGHRAVIRMAVSVLTALTFLHATVAQTFPYIPSTAVVPTLTSSSQLVNDVVYIFSPGSDSVDFLILNISSSVDASSPQFYQLPGALPFLDDASATTIFQPIIADDGTVIVLVGDCQADADFSVWQFAPDDISDGGSWTKQSATITGDNVGLGFLGASFAFSATLAPSVFQPTLYTYGGMCATPSTNVSGWQAGGSYSNQMMRLSPQSGSNSYAAAVITNNGPPVAEAGFTFTALTPSIRNQSGIVTQQSTHVLLGGHTSGAFINMSTAAVWNTPQETWTFLGIDQPSGGPTDLALKAANRRSADSVDSRSGHTAVLSEDGQSLVVLGGWVGDVSQAASPQLVVLEMGASYKSWQWSIPDQQPTGNGVYGHAAVLLPGNVMMTYGGYQISASTKIKRQASAESVQFLNLTSMAWTPTYDNPGLVSTGDGTTRAGSSSSSNSHLGIGLGVGLGVGVPLILLSISAYIYVRSRLNRKRHERDETIRALAQDTNRFLHGEDEMVERDDVRDSFPWATNAWYTGSHDPYQPGARSLGYESLRGNRLSRTGMQIPRKPIPRAARGTYQAANSRPSSHLSTPGGIHPIYEEIEPQETESSAIRSPFGDSAGPTTPTSVAHSDSWNIPPAAAAAAFPTGRGSATPSPESPHRDPEVQGWVSEVDATDALLARIPPRHAGKASPTRRGSVRSVKMEDDSRTGSTLSDSNPSGTSISRSASGRSHLRPGFGSSAGGTTLMGGSTVVAEERLGSSGSSSKDTFSTAKSSFGALQAEGPSLLMGKRRGEVDDSDDDIPVPASPSKNRPRRGWLGSLRKVFSGGTNSSPSSSRDESPVRESLDQVSSDYEPRLVGLSGIGGGALLRRKQGRQAWEGAKEREVEDDMGKKSAEDEWDIEKAVEQRLVQVMFTVPRERLRVVNAEIEKEEEVVLVDPERESQLSEYDVETPGKIALLDKGKVKETFEAREEMEARRDTPSPTLRTAEAVRLERRRTRVLDMVDTIEKRSGSASLDVE